jgi:putative membrane protein
MKKKYELRIRNYDLRPLIIGACAVALVAAIAAGCSKKSETSNSSDTTTMSAESTATAPPTTQSQAPPPASLSDANIIAMLDEADSAEITEAKLVLQKTKNPEVKSFANMMVTDHSRMRKEKDDLAKKLNITPQPPAGDQEPSSMTSELSALNGAASPRDMDSIYINDAVADHQKDSSDLVDLKSKATAPDLKDAITKAQPVVNKHLDHASMIQAKMMNMSGNMAEGARPKHGKTMEKKY